MRIGFLVGLMWLIFQSCVPPSKEVKSDVIIDMDLPEVQKLIDFQDKLTSDSLFPYLHSDDPTLQYLAIRAFASIKDKNSIDSIIPFLNDNNMDIRSIAAYALGQIGDEVATESLIESFVDQDTLDVDNILNANILEALGKISNEAIMANVASVESYRPDDTILLTGQVRSLYRFGLRNIKNQDATNTMMKYILDDTYPKEVRVMAGNYLARNTELDLVLYRDDLVRLLKREKNPHVRMCIAIAFRNLKDDASLAKIILENYELEKDYRVKIYMIRALGSFPYINVIEPIMEMIKDPNIHIASSAAQYLIDHGNASDSYLYRGLIQEDLPWQVKSKLYESVMLHTPIYYTRVKYGLSQEILVLINNTDNVYEKAAYINALSRDPYQYTNLLSLEAGSNVEKTAVAEGLKNQVSNANFIKAFGGNYIRIARAIGDSLIVKAKEGDPGVIVALSGLLKNKNFDWNKMIRDTSWQEDILESMTLPEDLEAFNELQSAIAALNGKEFLPSNPEYNHPIDWTLLSTITDSSRLVIKTSKGNFTLKMFKDEAPGSVANFVKLCQTDYYDGKVFHRVVPNFVIQGGCPIGDGYGALDYTIRSELSPLYYNDEGYIGMASAGNHTEGVQFFITHSPTPHLDGRYTIFGKVVDGMETIHEIQIGDRIIDAILTTKLN